jgi:hypothetical protein
MEFDDPMFGALPEYLSNDDAATYGSDVDTTKILEVLVENADDIIEAVMPDGSTKKTKKPKAAPPAAAPQVPVYQQQQMYRPAATSPWTIALYVALAGGVAYGGWWAYNRYWRR